MKRKRIERLLVGVIATAMTVSMVPNVNLYALEPSEYEVRTDANGKPIDLGGMELIIRDWWSSPDNPEYTEYQKWAMDTYNFKVTEVADYAWDECFDAYKAFAALPDDGKNYIYTLRNHEDMFELIEDGLVYDLSTLKNIDVFSPKYAASMVSILYNIGDGVYGMSPGISEPRDGFFVNKDLLRTYAGITMDDIYDMQKNGTWTWDAFEQICKNIQTNSGGTIAPFSGNNGTLAQNMIFANGGSFVGSNSDGYTYEVENSKTLSAMYKADEFLKKYRMEDPTYWVWNDEDPAKQFERVEVPAPWDYYITAFHDEKTVFICDGAYTGYSICGLNEYYDFDNWNAVYVKGPAEIVIAQDEDGNPYEECIPVETDLKESDFPVKFVNGQYEKLAEGEDLHALVANGVKVLDWVVLEIMIEGRYNTQNPVNFGVGFVMLPKGPNGDYVTPRENNVLVIPGKYNSDKAEKIALAFDLWSEEDGDFSVNPYEESFRNGFFDERAISETLPLMSSIGHGYINPASFIPGYDVNNGLMWDLGGERTVDELVAGKRNELKTALNEINATIKELGYSHALLQYDSFDDKIFESVLSGYGIGVEETVNANGVTITVIKKAKVTQEAQEIGKEESNNAIQMVQESNNVGDLNVSVVTSVNIDIDTYYETSDGSEYVDDSHQNEKITNINGGKKLSIPIKVPYYNPGATYKVVRVHENEDGTITRDVLETTDLGDGWISFESDKFSLFVLLKIDDREMMYRLYNPNSGEHFYTGSVVERDYLADLGWNSEGNAWESPKEGTPVYRLYNPNAGDHHYTTDVNEKNNLVAVGWNYENVAWNSAPEDEGIPVYRLYNPNAVSGAHHFTTSEYEKNFLVDLGWKDEGIAWYAY